jgi:ATP synthase protein I
MSSQGLPPEDDQGGADPWAAFGYLVAGVGLYGLAGWALGRWLHLDYLAPLGIVIGAGFGLYLVFAQLVRVPKDDTESGTRGNNPSTDGDNTPRPIDDDRGEIA